MGTAWTVIIRQVAKHANAFKSGNAATVSADYLTTPLTATQVVDPYFNLGLIEDACINAYGRLATEIANVRQHPWRVHVGPDVTAGLASGDTIPTTAGGKTIVGALGQVQSSAVLMTEAAPERVQMYLNATAVFDPLNPYLYYIDGNRIYHTVTLANINVCTYERDDTAAAVASDYDIGLPDVLINAIVAGAVAQLIVEGKGMEQATVFANYFQQAVESIRQGETRMPMFTLPATA